MADIDTDGLYDTSEPALSNRLDRFKRRIVESPIDRACQSLAMAIEDTESALSQVQTKAELDQARELVRVMTDKMLMLSSLGYTLHEHWTKL